MNIIDVNQVLAQHGREGQPLQMVRLSALEPRREPFAAVLCQPVGTIASTPGRIGNADSHTVLPMYRALLADALQSQAQILITPEYSVPWDLIREISAGPQRPPRGALWILGCESVTPEELELLQGALHLNPGVRLIHEPFDAQQRAQKTFVDPVVFVFWVVNEEGVDTLCLLVQFKTVVSRDPDHVELQSLYLGENVYKFTPQPGDVSLLTLICSDAFEFTNALVDAHCTNLLIVHIQLNQKPGNTDFAAYRARMFSVASNNNVEIVCLNWAAGVQINGDANPWIAVAGSAWYISPRGLTPTDADVNKAHHEGLYYSIVGQRWHAFYLAFAPHTLTVRKQPVFATGPQVLAPRIAPHVSSRRAWDARGGVWADSVADDGFVTFLQPYASLNGMLPPMCTQDPLAVERARELLEGPPGPSTDWFTLKELIAFHVAEEESLRRITVGQETDVSRSGVAFRRQRARRAQTAATMHQAVAWPPAISDLSNGFRYRWNQMNPHDNVEPLAGGKPAALLYLGEDPEPDVVANIFAKISRARKLHAATLAINGAPNLNGVFDLTDDRLCIAYRENQTLRFHRPKEYASISDPADQKADDIAGEHQ